MGLHHRQGLVQAPVVVLQKLGDPLVEVAGLPVAGQGQAHVVGVDLPEAVQIGAQGVLHLDPGGDVGGDVKEDVVSGEHDPLLLHPEAHLTGGVAGHQQALEAVAPHLQDLPVPKALIVPAGGRGHGAGGIGLLHPGQQMAGEALLLEALLQLVPVDLAGVEVIQGGAVGLTDVDGPVLGGLGGQSGVVGVEVGEQDVHLSPPEPQLPEPGEQGLPAGGLAEAGVDEDGPVGALDEIGVELLERVPRQGHGDAVNSFDDFLRHNVPPNRMKILMILNISHPERIDNRQFCKGGKKPGPADPKGSAGPGRRSLFIQWERWSAPGRC